MLALVGRVLKLAIKFALILLLTTIICTVCWEQFVNNHLYNCTDGGWLDYLDPGDWVHSWEGHPLQSVPHVVLDRDMEHSDSIQEGWTVQRLWLLWFAFFSTSLVMSAALALLPWRINAIAFFSPRGGGGHMTNS